MPLTNVVKVAVHLPMDMQESTRPPSTDHPCHSSRKGSRGSQPLLPKNPLELIPVPLHLNSQSVLLESHLFKSTFPQLGLRFHLLLCVFLLLSAPLSVGDLLIALGPQGILRKERVGEASEGAQNTLTSL